MSIEFDQIENGLSILALSMEEVRDLLDRVLASFSDRVDCPYECHVDVLFTDEEQIAELNRTMRGIDAPTDVLSFPSIDFVSPGAFGFLQADNMQHAFDPDSGELLLGDVALYGERIRLQAEEYEHSVKRELAYLFAHSLLHLIGFDHKTREEEKDMHARTEEILFYSGVA